PSPGSGAVVVGPAGSGALGVIESGGGPAGSVAAPGVVARGAEASPSGRSGSAGPVPHAVVSPARSTRATQVAPARGARRGGADLIQPSPDMAASVTTQTA